MRRDAPATWEAHRQVSGVSTRPPQLLRSSQDKSFKDDVDTALRAAILPHIVQFKELHCKDSWGPRKP